MVWFRLRRRFWAGVALAGLVFQLALSFGHVHGRADLRLEAATASAASSSASPEHGDHEDQYCATCAILTLLTGAQTSSAPQVAPCVACRSAEVDVHQVVRADTASFAFSSRAPPQA
jgi:hypothetical protein